MFKLQPPSTEKTTHIYGSVNIVYKSLEVCLPVGRSALLRLGGVVRLESEPAKRTSEFPEERIQIPAGVTPQNLKDFTLYDMLGFTPEWADSADVEAIKKAYHKAVLMYHPDKAQYKTSDGKEDRSVFLKIQEAFNVLTNEQKRRAYDSQLPFDESIPTEERVNKALAKGHPKFFKLFDTVFKRNARFAVKKPVPEIGNMETPLADVYRFYDYWVNFDSWRDFTGVGAEHNPDHATSREEKRYMVKENERLAKKLKKKEMERLIALVTLAQAKDPRLVAEKEQKRAAKAAKEAELQQKAQEEAEAKAWAASQEQAIQDQRNLSKADREKQKKLQSNARNILRKLLRVSATAGHGAPGNEYGILSTEEVELLCARCDLNSLNAMNDAMGGAAATKDESLFQIAGSSEVLSRLTVLKEAAAQEAEDERLAKEAKRLQLEAEKEARETKDKKKEKQELPRRQWSRDSLSLLAKSIIRYPAGFADRWAMITCYMNDQLKPGIPFTTDELLTAAFNASKNSMPIPK